MSHPKDQFRPDDPDYYQGKYQHQQWDIAYEQWGAGALLAHALKYILRAGKKPTSPMLRDVRNAINYLRHLEEKLVQEMAVANPTAPIHVEVIPSHRHVFYSGPGADWGICDICGKLMTRKEFEEQDRVTSVGGHP